MLDLPKSHRVGPTGAEVLSKLPDLGHSGPRFATLGKSRSNSPGKWSNMGRDRQIFLKMVYAQATLGQIIPIQIRCRPKSNNSLRVRLDLARVCPMCGRPILPR